jgi:predicted Rossmann-fold nucleotide-binding protein
MFVPQIGVTGHRPTGFTNPEYARELAELVVDYCARIFHGLEFNLGGCVGADMWVAQACVEQNIPFNLMLPFPADIQGKYWSKEEMDFLSAHILRAKTTSVVGRTYNVKNYHIRDRQIVDKSHLIICFWEGRRSGGTYNTIRYALGAGTKVLNAMNELQEVSL